MSKFISLKSLPTILEPLKRLISHKAQDVDWNENDSASPSYIANRTHYKSTEFVTDMPETSIEFSYVEGLNIFSSEELTVALNVSEGDKRIVTWDGVRYDCIVKRFDSLPYLGNLGILIGDAPNSGEPFLIMITYAGAIQIGTADTAATHTISIYGESTIVHKIPKEYLPEIGVGKKFEGNNGSGEIFNDYENNSATGQYSHAEGSGTSSLDSYSHAEGHNTSARGYASHTEGNWTKASGCAHAEGDYSEATGWAAHAEGYQSIASAAYSHAEGGNTTASAEYSHAEGSNTIASGALGSHAEGHYTEASSRYQHVQGKYNVKDIADKYAHIVGNGTSDTARSNAHTLDWNGNAWFEGDVYVGGTEQSKGEKLVKQSELPEIPNTNIVNGEAAGSLRTINSAAESDTYKLHENAFAEGTYTQASGYSSHAEGYFTESSGVYSHAEGQRAKASGNSSHAEGHLTEARNWGSHAEGERSIASGQASHAEGYSTKAEGAYSHAQGYGTHTATKSTNVIGEYNDPGKLLYTEKVFSTTLPSSNKYYLLTGDLILDPVSGYYSFNTATEIAQGDLQVGNIFSTANNSIKKYYRYDTINSGISNLPGVTCYEALHYSQAHGQYVHIVGNGTSETARSNAHTLDWNGLGWFAGGLKIGGTGQDDENAVSVLTENDLAVITESEIDAICGNDNVETWQFTMPDGTITEKQVVVGE